MNLSFVFKGLQVSAPQYGVEVKLDEIKYSVEKANVLEIAKASTKIAKAFKDIINEMEGTTTPSSNYEDKFHGLGIGDVVYTDDAREAIILGFNAGTGIVELRIACNLDDSHDFYIEMYPIELVSKEKPDCYKRAARRLEPSEIETLENFVQGDTVYAKDTNEQGIILRFEPEHNAAIVRFEWDGNYFAEMYHINSLSHTQDLSVDDKQGRVHIAEMKELKGKDEEPADTTCETIAGIDPAL